MSSEHAVELATTELQSVVTALYQDALFWCRKAAEETTPQGQVERLQKHAREISALAERLRALLPPGRQLPYPRS